ncbi:MAG: hypothetical protein IPM57_01805 [Oligoflexia bacterium]|nr:hypothetical protein [Oligoflexia bacterium]
MIKFILCSILIIFASTPAGFAQQKKSSAQKTTKKVQPKKSTKSKKSSQKQATKKVQSKVNPQKSRMVSPAQQAINEQRALAPALKQSGVKNSAALQRALNLASQKQYEEASRILFSLSRNPRFYEERARIKYILGLMFQEMKMYQAAAFQFVDVVRSNNPSFTRQSLQKLSIVADALNDDTLLNYAIGKINADEFPKANQDMLRFRIGEYLMRKNKFDSAADSFARVQSVSPFYSKAKYMEALSKVKTNDLNGAMRTFKALAEARRESGITDVSRVSAVAGMARVAYQQKNWDLSIELYRQIPKDTEIWHDTLFESSWAHMRSARFRSVLSNLHSLHSPYYEDFYLPESILLRGIVYLYICQYDEMEKTLALFEKIYGPVHYKLEQYVAAHSDPQVYFRDMEKIISNFNTLKEDTQKRENYRIPFLVARDIMREGDFKSTYQYINRLREESAAIESKSNGWRNAPIGIYAKQIIKGRLQSAQKTAGNLARNHIVNMKNEMADLFEQYNFAKYEMINGKKEALKKKIQGKGLKSNQVDDSKNRDFYIQNGFEYWPFFGEYWLDEIGDYYYVGTQGCE